MSPSTRGLAGCSLFLALSVVMLILFSPHDFARAQQDLLSGAAAVLGPGSQEKGSESSEEKQGITFPAADMEEGLREAAAEVGEH